VIADRGIGQGQGDLQVALSLVKMVAGTRQWMKQSIFDCTTIRGIVALR